MHVRTGLPSGGLYAAYAKFARGKLINLPASLREVFKWWFLKTTKKPASLREVLTVTGRPTDRLSPGPF